MGTVYTNIGQEKSIDYIQGTDTPPANYYVGWGTGAGAAAIGDTALAVEASEARVTPVETQPTADVARFVATMTAAGPKTITEAALFTAAAAGSMMVRGDFTGIVLAGSDQIEFTIDLKLKDVSEP